MTTPASIINSHLSKSPIKAIIKIPYCLMKNTYGCFCKFQAAIMKITVKAGYRPSIKKKGDLLFITLHKI